MRKKIGENMLAVVFVGLVCSISVWWFFLEKYVDTNNYENREKASLPSLTMETYSTFATDYNSYYNDNMPFRNSMVNLQSLIDLYLFDKSSNANVVIGKNGWLFYANKADGDPVGMLQGNDLYTEEQLQEIAANCIAQRDFLLSQGTTEFYIFIAPNKERVYSEYIPNRFGVTSDTYKALQVVEYLLRYTDINVVYPYEEMMEAKIQVEHNLYYKTDTHWNDIGGYIGAEALLSEMGVRMPDISQVIISSDGAFAGDLASMLNMTEMLKSSDEHFTLYGWTEQQIEIIDEDETYHYVSDALDQRRIFIRRDSYGSAMRHYISAQFSETLFVHKLSYTYDQYLEYQPDVFVYETVERYINDLATFSVQ